MAMPLQGFSSYFTAWLAFSWYWSGAGLFVACAISSPTAGMLLLVFWHVAPPPSLPSLKRRKRSSSEMDGCCS